MRFKEQKGSLQERTLELLKESGKPAQDIYAETGLPFYWVRKFLANEIDNPSVNRVQFLYEHLSGSEIKLL